MQFIDLERPIAELEEKIEALRKVARHDNAIGIKEEIEKLQAKSRKLTEKIFAGLDDWGVIKFARHPERPHTIDYNQLTFTDFQELHGDRQFGDDQAIIGGLARLEGQPVMVIGQEKGRNTKEKLRRNFGMPHPEGYRKALRLMKLAERFKLPVITLIDTPGAYPGINAEARGQSEAIAHNLEAMSTLAVPIICAVIGEGCSGGALGIGAGDCLLMFEYSYFATISPEGCASILWKSVDKAPQAAEIMGITAKKLSKYNFVDQVIAEPLGGAHRDYATAAATLKQVLVQQLTRLDALSTEELLAQRYQRTMSYGQFQSG